MTETTRKFKKQLPKNVTMAVLAFVTYSVTAIWLTPYLVKHLGPAAYGLVPLAGLLTQYAALITAQISSAINRFLTIEIQKPDGNPNVVFNSSFALYVILVVIQLPVFGAAVYFADRLFSFPPELKKDVLILLGCSACSFLINMIGSVFGISRFATNRLDLGSTIALCTKILSLILIVVTFSIFGPKLRYIGIIGLFLQCISFGVSLVLWRKLTPELTIRSRDIDWKLLGPVLHMSVWTLFNQLGALLYMRTDLWIINRFISPVAAGKYAVVLVIANFVRQLSSLFGSQLPPTIMGLWAKDDLINLKRLLGTAGKLSGTLMAIPAVFICLNSKAILEMWMGEDYTHLSRLLVIMCFYIPFSSCMKPLMIFNTASNTVRIPALVTFVLGICNVALSFLLGITFELGPEGIAAASAIMLLLKNDAFLPLYNSKILGIHASYFFQAVPGILLVFGIGVLLSRFPIPRIFGLDEAGFPGLALQGIFFALCSLILIWFLMISRAEKTFLTDLLPKWARISFIQTGKS